MRSLCLQKTGPKLLKAVKEELDSLKSLLACDAAMDALCEEDVFGAGYQEACENRVQELQSIINQAEGRIR